MEDTNTLSLQELHVASSQEQEPDHNDNDEQSQRQHGLDRKRIVALVGSALSQLPIWGILYMCLESNRTNGCRLRDELWCTPRILL
jgi:hypothetical protein